MRTAEFSSGLGRAVLFLYVLFSASSAFGYESVYWEGEEKCDTLFASPISQLPGGSYLTQILGEDAVQAHYLMPQGGKLRLTVREVGRVTVSGDTYSQVYLDILKRKPLQDRLARKLESGTVLADVKTTMGVSFRPVKTDDGAAYMIAPQSLTMKLISKVRVTDWAEYNLADQYNQNAWDKHLCTSYHHELGHILVAAQVLEESETEWLALRVETLEALNEKHQSFVDEISERVRERQQAYHDALDEMGAKLGRSRPYMELPFPWLKNDGDVGSEAANIKP